MNGSNTAFLILTDKWYGGIERYHEIRKAVADSGEVFLLFHEKEHNQPAPGNNQAQVYRFTNESIAALPYIPIAGTLVPGSNHFPLLQFFNDYPSFEHYWLIEDDVRFNGSWSYFFNYLNAYRHDFISSYIYTFNNDPDWTWWHTLSHPIEKVYNQQKISSFNPVYRISGPALHYIHYMLTCLWKGHHEVLFPTLLQLGGFSLLDFGGLGHFAPPELKNKFYALREPKRAAQIACTFRYRPVWKEAGAEENKLYHPVKNIEFK
jgi:hypothetical protein